MLAVENQGPAQGPEAQALAPAGLDHLCDLE